VLYPPSIERVEANIATAATLPAGGTLGADSFRAAMQKTLQLKPAYETYDDGRKALANKEFDKALTLSNEALRQFGGEAHFHALRGDVRLVTDKYDMAITNYSRAIDRRDDFFYYHLQRGLAKKELRQTDAAVVDLERSIALLPTAPAHYALGTIHEQRGNLENAIKHYKAVAGGGGDYGRAANAALVRLELPSNPASYLPRRCDAGTNGNLIVSVKNNTTVSVTNVQIAVSYADSAGRPRQLIREIRSRIPPGQIASIDTGMGPYTGSSCPAEVVSARVLE
jgi:tetratricopeptide (TPR) repeat protein